jgi:mono/diheme cytochrome c family protein
MAFLASSIHRRTLGRHRLVAGLVVLAVIGLAVALSLWFLSTPKPAVAPSAAADFNRRSGNAARGAIVFAAADCASCHATPGQPDRLRLGGGLALPSSFGTFRIPNISSDPNDGIGQWQASDLANALMSGVSPAGQHYYPGLPYTSYARMDAQDVIDLYAYLHTLPAVAGKVPPHELPLIFKIRRAIGLWKLLYLDRTPIVADASKPLDWNRGRYLVEAVAHCAECHSSRNVLGAIKAETRFAGGMDPGGAGFVPNITPTGIGAWTAEDLARLLRDGHTPDGRVTGSAMADVVTNTAMLSEADRNAIAAYIKSLPARPTPPP